MTFPRTSPWRPTAAVLALITAIPMASLEVQAEPVAPGNWLQLRRIDNENNKRLKQIQKNAEPPPSALTPAEARDLELFNLQQSQQLQSLQKQQRHESATTRQRYQAEPGSRPGQPAAQQQRLRFSREQQNQLNNARIQQQIRSGLR